MKRILVVACSLAVALIGTGTIGTAEATQFLTNLGNPAEQPGVIGDIESIFAGTHIFYGRFQTGAQVYHLNDITLQFYGDGVAQAPNMTVQLLEKTGTSNTYIADLISPTLNPAQTLWPRSTDPNSYTTYVDFHPSVDVVLSPLSTYVVSITNALNSSGAGYPMFSETPGYVTPSDWVMLGTQWNGGLGGRIAAFGSAMYLAVDATVVPEPSLALFLWLAGAGLGFRYFRRHACMRGAGKRT